MISAHTEPLANFLKPLPVKVKRGRIGDQLQSAVQGDAGLIEHHHGPANCAYKLAETESLKVIWGRLSRVAREALCCNRRSR